MKTIWEILSISNKKKTKRTCLRLFNLEDAFQFIFGKLTLDLLWNMRKNIIKE